MSTLFPQLGEDGSTLITLAFVAADNGDTSRDLDSSGHGMIGAQVSHA